MPNTIVSILNLETFQNQVNSPRSIEACSRLGIDPNDLQPRSLKEFEKEISGNKSTMKNVPENQHLLLHDHFNNNRKKLLHLFEKEREKIIEEQKNGMSTILLNQFPNNESLVMDSSTMIKTEEKRIERIKRKQEKEIQALLDMETKMAKIQLENSHREKLELKRKKEWEREIKKKKQQAILLQRERDLKRKQNEELEDQRKRELAKKNAEKERQILLEEIFKEKKHHQEAMKKEIERLNKAEEHRKQTEALIRAQEEQASENKEKMMEKEKEVHDKILLANELRSKLAQQKRIQAEKRIQDALMTNHAVLQRKKLEFEQKQITAKERTKEVQAKQLAELQKRKEKNDSEEKLRQKRIYQAKLLMENRITHLVEKKSDMDQHLQRVYQEREMNRRLVSFKKKLTSYDKIANVERNRKVDEFQRFKILQKIYEENEKTKIIKRKKEQLILARKKFALDSVIRKQQIADAVEKMKVTNKWTSLDKVIDKCKPYNLGALKLSKSLPENRWNEGSVGEDAS